MIKRIYVKKYQQMFLLFDLYYYFSIERRAYI